MFASTESKESKSSSDIELITQKEFVMTELDAKVSIIIGTASVRGCYAITMYHL